MFSILAWVSCVRLKTLANSSRTVRVGSTSNSWRRYAIFMLFLARASSPLSGVRFPMMICSCVVLPAPFTPTSPTRSPFLTSQLMSLRTFWFLKEMETFVRRMPDVEPTRPSAKDESGPCSAPYQPRRPGAQATVHAIVALRQRSSRNTNGELQGAHVAPTPGSRLSPVKTISFPRSSASSSATSRPPAPPAPFSGAAALELAGAARPASCGAPLPLASAPARVRSSSSRFRFCS